MSQFKGTPGKWRWRGEDYRGGWGWQLLVNDQDVGIICGQSSDGSPYKHLKAYTGIEPQYTATGMLSDKDSAPCVHVQQADANLIVAAPQMFYVLEELQSKMADLIKLANEVGINDADGFYLGHAVEIEEKAREVINLALGKGK